MSYFAVPVFWTSAVIKGVFPVWIPFQSMGYPIFLNPSSGINYPPLWVFPVLGIQYTMHNAVLFEALHVFAGSIGMFLFIRSILKNPYYALVAAITFQFFGGFYANAQHVDIVRAFAVSPWLFYVFTTSVKKPAITKAVLFAPIVIYFLGTGGYFGNLIASYVIVAIFILFQGLNYFLHGSSKKHSLKIVAVLFSMLALSVGLLTVQFLPIVDNVEVYERTVPTELVHYELEPEYFLASLFFSNNEIIPGEPSMTSSYITLPLLVLATFAPLASVKKHWPFLGVFVVSILMSLGEKSFFWQFMTDTFWPLHLSRFPVSDYRVFVIIPMIVFGILGLKSIIENKISLPFMLIRAGIVFAWFFYILYGLNNWPDYLSSSLTVLVMTVGIAMFVSRKELTAKILPLKRNWLFTGVLIVIVSLIVFDGLTIVNDMKTWGSKNWDYKLYENFSQQLNPAFPTDESGNVMPMSIFDNLPDKRPPREITASRVQLSWAGYYDGSYMMEDYGGVFFMADNKILKDGIYKTYMHKEWTPILLDIDLVSNDYTLLKEHFTASKESNSVTQIRYGVNEIKYEVNLDEPKVMIENEKYFDGWKAELKLDNVKTIEAIAINDVFRGWVLPAGQYDMRAYFEFPNYTIMQVVSLSMLFVWMFVLVTHWKNMAEITQELGD